MRKTLKRNLAYDDRNHLYYVSLYYDGENGRRVRRTRTYQTMEQAEQVIAEQSLVRLALEDQRTLAAALLSEEKEAPSDFLEKLSSEYAQRVESR